MRNVLVYVQSVLYILAGLNHFRRPAGYAAIVPRWLPSAALLVQISGVAELLLGLLLLVPATRGLAAWGIIALLIAVFPANIQMAVNYVREGHPYAWATLLRLPLQAVLVWLIWWSTRPTV